MTFSIDIRRVVLAVLLCYTSVHCQTSCDRRFIHSIDSYYIYGYSISIPLTECSFYDLLASGDCTFWCVPSTEPLPITIDIYFTEPLILEGLSTQGTHDGYVGSFGILYSDDSSSITPLNTIELPDANGYTVFFSSPVKVQHLRLIIFEAYVSPFSFLYHWHINIIGCSVSSLPLPTTITNTIVDNGTSNDSSPYSVPPPHHANVIQSVIYEPSIDQSSIVQLPLFSAPSILCTDTTVRVTIRQTLVTTQTVTVVSSVFILSSPGMSFIEESNQAGTVVDSYRNYFFPVLAIATIFLVIFLIFITSIILIGVWKKGRLRRKRRSTLLEVQNVNMYEMEDSINTLSRQPVNCQPVAVPITANIHQQRKNDQMRMPLLSDSNEYDVLDMSQYRLPADAIDSVPPIPPRRTVSNKQYVSVD